MTGRNKGKKQGEETRGRFLRLETQEPSPCHSHFGVNIYPEKKTDFIRSFLILVQLTLPVTLSVILHKQPYI